MMPNDSERSAAIVHNQQTTAVILGGGADAEGLTGASFTAVFFREVFGTR